MNVVIRRRVIALVVLVAALAAAIPLLLAGGDDDSADAPAATTVPRETSLVSALAPLLDADGRAGDASDRARGDAGGADPGGRVTTGASDTDLGLSPVRAAARLFVVGFPGATPDVPFLARMGVREWGGVVLDSGNVVDEAGVAALVAAIRTAAQEADNPVPIVAVRQAGGADSEIEGLPPRPQSQQSSADIARSEAGLAGRRLRQLGIGMTLAPDADLASEGGPWDGRGFAEEARTVAARVRAAVRGYRAAGVAAAVGHFPGEGAASQEPRLGIATVALDLEVLRREDVRPFARVAREAPVVAMSESLYAAFDSVTPATLLPEAVALLRGTGFDGAVLSGELGAASFAAGIDPGEAAVAALAAGCDLLLLRGDARDQERAVQAVARAIRNGELPAARVREALARGTALRRRYVREPLAAASVAAATAAPAG